MTRAFVSLMLAGITLLPNACGAAVLDCALINDTAPSLLDRELSDFQLKANFCDVENQITEAIDARDVSLRRECTRAASFYFGEMTRRDPSVDRLEVLKSCP